MAGTTSGEENELRHWFRQHGLEPPSPGGRFDRQRWRTGKRAETRTGGWFVAVVAAFLVVLVSGAVWLHGRHAAAGHLSGEGLQAAGQCGVSIRAAEHLYPPLVNLPDGGQILYSNAGHACYWEVTFRSTPPSRLLGALRSHGFHVSWTYGDPSPKRPTPVLPMSQVAPGGNINPATSSSRPS